MLPILCLCRWIKAGARSESRMYRCVWRTVMSGGRTAKMIWHVRRTGTKDGTGAQVRSHHNRDSFSPFCSFAYGHTCNAKIYFCSESQHIWSENIVECIKGLHLLCVPDDKLNLNNHISVLQVVTNAPKAASAESGPMSTQRLNPCVKKFGQTPIFIRGTPKHQGGACSSGSLDQTLTQRLLSITSTMLSNLVVFHSHGFSSWLHHLFLHWSKKESTFTAWF